jgi:hypothetical protein
MIPPREWACACSRVAVHPLVMSGAAEMRPVAASVCFISRHLHCFSRAGLDGAPLTGSEADEPVSSDEDFDLELARKRKEKKERGAKGGNGYTQLSGPSSAWDSFRRMLRGEGGGHGRGRKGRGNGSRGGGGAGGPCDSWAEMMRSKVCWLIVRPHPLPAPCPALPLPCLCPASALPLPCLSALCPRRRTGHTTWS